MNTFATQPNTQRRALEKALKSPRIGKHGKRRVTLLKEEVYRSMQQKILDKVEILIDAQMKVALTGNRGKPDTKSIDSLLNRAFGRPAQEIALKHEVEETGPTPESRERARILIDKLLGGK